MTDVDRRIFFIALPRGFWRTRTAHRAHRAVILSVVLVCMMAGSVSGRCAETPAVTGLAVRQAGAFVAASPQEAAATGRRHRLAQEGATIASEAGAAFGVIFEVHGAPAGAPVMIEAGLVPPGNDPVPQRWFVPAVIGEKGQAVASFVYAWEAVPGPWRLTLAEEGRVLAEQTFHVGGSQHAPPAPPVAPASPPPPPQAPAPAPFPESSSPAAVPPAASPAAAPAAPEHPVAAGQPAAPGQPVASAPTVPPLPAPGTAPEGHAPPAAVIPGPASPPVATVAPEAAVPVETPRTPEKAPDHIPEKNSDKGKKAPSLEQGVKAPGKAPAKETAKANGTLYLLQTGIFSVRDNAFSQAARYRAKGYPGCVLEEGAGSKRRYRVIVGRFPDHDRAMEARRAFAGREGGEVMVKEFPAAEVSRRLKCR